MYVYLIIKTLFYNINDFIVLQERDLFNRERAGGCYRTSAYFFAKTFVEAPILLCFPILFGTIAYWSVGFQPIAECFGVFLACLISFAAGKLM